MEKMYYGRGKDTDNKKLIKFLNEVFFINDKAKRDFFTLLPKIYKDQYRPAYNNFVVQDDNGNFRAAIGDFYSDMTVGEEDIFTCCIGNVAVGKNYRSKGYMIELMNISIEDMVRQGIDMAFLGGQRQRYGYFGFESAGVRYNFGFNRKTVKHALGEEPSGINVVEIKEEDTETFEKINSIYGKNPIRTKRSMDRYYDVLCSWQSIPYVMFDGKEFVGYFVIGRDSDSVLECGTVSAEYLPKMVKAVFETVNSDSYHVNFPTAPFEKDKVKFFTENAEGMDIGGCESILVFNYEKTIRAFLKAKAQYSKLCNGEMTVLIHGQRADEKLKISVENSDVVVEKYDGAVEYELNHHDATRLFFSNYPSDRDVLRPELQQWLPLHVFMFGTDTM